MRRKQARESEVPMSTEKESGQKRRVCLAAVLIAGGAAIAAHHMPDPRPDGSGQGAIPSPAASVSESAPLCFIGNQGQLDRRVAYTVQGRDKTLHFTSQGITFALVADSGADPAGYDRSRLDAAPGDRSSFSPLATAGFLARHAVGRRPGTSRRWAVTLEFVSPNPARPAPRGEGRTPATVSYFKGPESCWRTGLKTYSRLVYKELWPGIDLVYSTAAHTLKYQFVVRPGADPGRIRLAYRGAAGVPTPPRPQEIRSPGGRLQDVSPDS
jgi:hypothetical protein